jgi:hypothetical protein
MISGVAYTLIGIKNRHLHISLSAGYLASLGVTVLILYVMNPPVSNAIQGAYLVAIVMTGLIIGAASLIFTELTEGLGCLLGGFCLSMWFLVLKPGGLLTSTGGIAAFIASFSLTAFATSFSHITRPYGLIVFVSFGGATAIVLGIDCVSRAGLKEFWAYIWNLNGTLFPVGATTYPLTRGLRVEIAAIVIISLAGIASQAKLWNVIKRRREERAAIQLEEETRLQREEEEVGRRIEARAARDRDRWEAVYGEKDGTKSPEREPRDSGVADVDSQKRGTKSTNSNDDIEMGSLSPDVAAVSKGHEIGAVTVRVARDIEPPLIIDENGNELIHPAYDQSAVPRSFPTLKGDGEIWVVGMDGQARLEKKPSKTSITMTKTPAVVPLPFRVPDEEEEIKDDRSSVATFADDEQTGQKRMSKRLSTGSTKRLSAGSAILRRLSNRSKRSSLRFSAAKGNSTEDLVIPHVIEDDRRSSLAATMDGLSDEDEDMRSVRSITRHTESTEHNPTQTKEDDPVVSIDTKSNSDTGPLSGTDTLKLTPENEQEREEPAVPKSLTSSTDPKPTLEMPTTTDASDETEKLPEEPTPSVASRLDSKPSSLTAASLPAQLSKVVMSYRTNEWAKHLSTADAPEVDTLNLSAEHEAAVPLNIMELQQTATSAPARKSVVARPTSVISTNHQDPNIRTLPFLNTRMTQNHRISSTPNIPHRIVESPVEDYFPISQISAASGPPQSHAKFSSPSTLKKLVRKSSTQSSINGMAPLPDDDGDDISLSARRSLIRKSSATSTMLSTSASQPNVQVLPLASSSPYSQHASYSSQTSLPSPYETRRQSSAPSPQAREAQLRSFRSSIQNDRQSIVPTKANIEAGRQVLWEQRRKEEIKKKEEDRRKAEKEREMENRMRRDGSYLDLHKEGMRRMQANVKQL